MMIVQLIFFKGFELFLAFDS